MNFLLTGKKKIHRNDIPWVFDEGIAKVEMIDLILKSNFNLPKLGQIPSNELEETTVRIELCI